MTSIEKLYSSSNANSAPGKNDDSTFLAIHAGEVSIEEHAITRKSITLGVKLKHRSPSAQPVWLLRNVVRRSCNFHVKEKRIIWRDQ